MREAALRSSRLELGGVFKSWAVTRGPSDDPADKRWPSKWRIIPLDYGDFEGTDSGGRVWRWNVQLWDRGYWTPEGSNPPSRRFVSGDLKFTLDGRAPARQLGPGAHEAGSQRRQAHQLAAHQTSRRERALRRGRRADGGRPLGGFGARDERDRGRKGRPPKPFMVAGSKGARANAVWKSDRATRVTAMIGKPATRSQRRRVRQ